MTIHRGDLNFRFIRGQGPGGQAVNKLATTAQLRIAISALDGLDEGGIRRLERFAGRRLTQSGEIVLEAGEHRSQKANRRACLERLEEMVLRAATPPRRRRKTRPSAGVRRRRREAKEQQSQRKRERRQKRDPGE